MKTEKIKSKLKKAFNRVMGVLLPVSTLLVSCDTNALVVHAADNSNQVKVISTLVGDPTTTVIDQSFSVSGNAEIVAYLQGVNSGNEIIYYTVRFGVVENGSYRSLKKGEFSGTETTIKDGKVQSTNQITAYVLAMPYKSNSTDIAINYQVVAGNFKLFKSLDDVKVYASSGAGDYDIIKPDTIDDGIKDSDIGYLHNLQMNQLQSGKQDENGIYERYSDRFTWDDTYPEYDSSYLVEVRGKCVVQTRGFLGLGKTKTYTSDIENIAKDISYNDLEWIVSSTDKYAPFNSFINEHMPTNLVMTGVYGMRDLYFRIYKWSEADDCYHYGPWVNMHFVDDDVWVSVDGDTTMGDFDEDGNFIVDPDSDYGTGKKNDVGVGVGDTEEDAKKDNDRRNEEKKNDDGKLDLSNASISDIWYWFVTSLSNLYNSLGFIPEFFQKIFSFLPTPIYVFLGIGIVVAILLRVLGR